MARVPLTKEEVTPARLVLNVEKVGLTEEQFFRLCSDNSDLCAFRYFLCVELPVAPFA